MSLVSGCCLKASLTFVAMLELAEELELLRSLRVGLELLDLAGLAVMLSAVFST